MIPPHDVDYVPMAVMCFVYFIAMCLHPFPFLKLHVPIFLHPWS